MKRFPALFLVLALISVTLISVCNALGKQITVPEEKLKNAYFSLITCQTKEARGQFNEAERYCKMGIQELNGYIHPMLEPLHSPLANIYLRQNRYEEAKKIQIKLIEITAQTVGKDSPNHAIALAAYGSSMVMDGKFAEGKPYIDEALPILKDNVEVARNLAGDSFDWYQSALNRKAMILVSQLKDAEAIATHRELSKNKGKHNVTDAELKTSLATTYAQVGETYFRLPTPNITKARSFYEKALAMNKQASAQLPKVQQNAKMHIKTQVIPHPHVVMAGHHLAYIYRNTGLTKQANELECSLRGWAEYYRAHPLARE